MFLNKCLLAQFCLQYTSHEFCYRPCHFHFNILNGFEIIAKTLSVALEVSLSIFLARCARKICARPVNTGITRLTEVCKNIRVLHECQVWIDKSVPRVTFWHHKACRVMPNCDPRDRFVYPYLTRMMDSFSCTT